MAQSLLILIVSSFGFEFSVYSIALLEEPCSILLIWYYSGLRKGGDLSVALCAVKVHRESSASPVPKSGVGNFAVCLNCCVTSPSWVLAVSQNLWEMEHNINLKFLEMSTQSLFLFNLSSSSHHSEDILSKYLIILPLIYRVFFFMNPLRNLSFWKSQYISLSLIIYLPKAIATA